MRIILSLVGTVGIFALFYVFHILAEISEKLGAVTKMPRYYRGFYVAQAFLLAGFYFEIFRVMNSLQPDFGNPAVHPLIIIYGSRLALFCGALIGVVITCIYWKWLILGQDK